MPYPDECALLAVGAWSGFRRRGHQHINIFFKSYLLIISGSNQDLLYFAQVLAIRGTPQAIVSNFVNTRRQHMLEKTPDELLGADGHGSCLGAAGTLIPKGHLAVIDRDDSAVGNSDTVNVASEIIEDLTGALDGRFTVDNPFLSPYGFRQVNILKSPPNTLEKDSAKSP